MWYKFKSDKFGFIELKKHIGLKQNQGYGNVKFLIKVW